MKYGSVRRGHRRLDPIVRAAALLGCALITLFSQQIHAAPTARILRIDPRAAQENGNPVLTTVIEVSQSKRLSEAVGDCAALTGNAQLDCMSTALEKPLALYTPFPFPAQAAQFLVKVEGSDIPAKYVSHTQWGESQQQPGVGTAWLILIDDDRRMGRSFEDAKRVALQFVNALGPNDIVNVMFFNDRAVIKDSHWLPASQKARASSFISSVADTVPSAGRNRALLSIIKAAATDGFKALGNAGDELKVPLHQALVVLSSGFGGTDPMTTGPGALQLSQYLTQGRFPEDNSALPKAPVPVISIYTPPSTYQEFALNSLEFMQNLANTEIGGFFTVLREGGSTRAPAIVNAVRQRFSKMQVVKWRVACVAPSVTQSFGLYFTDAVRPQIAGDTSFKDVPIGLDPTTWPLDVNVQYTSDMIAREGGVHPGGEFKIYGDFCWGGDKSRAEVYFLPAGQALPTALAGTDIEKAKRTQQQLIEWGMKGEALESGDAFVKFQAPDTDKILHGSGDQAVVRLVIYDNRAHRMTGVTADTIIKLKGTTAPLPILLILGSLFGLVVLTLLIVVVFKSGGKKRVAAAPPPGPVAAGPVGYGAPPLYAGAPAPVAYGGAPQAAYPGGMVAPAAPAPLAYSAPAQAAPGPLTSAVLSGAAGTFTLLIGQELKAGRDSAQCGIVLGEPRVSGVHATLKLEGGQLLIRDENSNNGTFVNNVRLNGGVWTPIASGSLLRLGPVELSVRLQ